VSCLLSSVKVAAIEVSFQYTGIWIFDFNLSSTLYSTGDGENDRGGGGVCEVGYNVHIDAAI
jgi:hypothetical protein